MAVPFSRMERVASLRKDLFMASFAFCANGFAPKMMEKVMPSAKMSVTSLSFSRAICSGEK